MHFADECHRNGTSRVEFLGLDAMTPRSTFPSCMRTRTSQCGTSNPRFPNGDLSAPDGDGASVSADHSQHDAPVSAAIAAADDAMTWLSLSEPAASNSGLGEACDRDVVERARAEMDWIDLQVASGNSRSPRSRDAEARAALDWLGLMKWRSSARPWGA
jgi:hypothetical protein